MKHVLITNISLIIACSTLVYACLPAMNNLEQLTQSVAANNIETTTNLLAAIKDRSSFMDIYGMHILIKAKTVAMAELLLHYGCKPSQVEYLMHYIAQDEGYAPDLIPLYVRHGANPTFQSKHMYNNDTPLHRLIALHLPYNELTDISSVLAKVTHLLTAAPQLLTCTNADGLTPIAYAQKRKNSMRYLQKPQAFITAYDRLLDLFAQYT